MENNNFAGSEGSPISLALAATWTKNYRDNNPGQTIAHFFGTDIIQQILSQGTCMGIRIYYAADDSGAKQLILVGADAHQNDMTDGILADYSMPCPAICSTANPLNSVITVIS